MFYKKIQKLLALLGASAIFTGCAANYQNEKQMYSGPKLSGTDTARVYQSSHLVRVRSVDGVDIRSSVVNTVFEFEPGPHVFGIEIEFVKDFRSTNHAFYDIQVDLKAGNTYVPDSLTEISELAPKRWCLLEEPHNAPGVTYPKYALDYDSNPRTPSKNAVRVACGNRVK